MKSYKALELYHEVFGDIFEKIEGLNKSPERNRFEIVRRASRGGRRGIHPLPSNGKVSLNRLFAPKMPHKGLK